MKRVVLFLLLISLVFTTAVLAGKPVEVEGDFTYSPVIVGEKWAGDNQFIYATDTGEWTGDMVGTSYEEYVVVLHGSEGDFVYETGNYHGTATFDGTVAGQTGTLVIRFVGKSEGSMVDWTGTWRIISASGGLAGMQGQGTFYMNGFLDVHYQGWVH